MKKVKILDVQFDVSTRDESLSRALFLLQNTEQARGHYIVTPNPEMLLEARKNLLFRDILNRAALSIPDGIGILWASTFQEISKRSGATGRLIKAGLSLASLLFLPKFCQKVFPERITGVDFMQSLIAAVQEFDVPVFLLGAKPGVAEDVKKILETKYPRTRIVGTFSGSPHEDDFPRIQSLIAETRPALLFVAYGAPAQEFWIAKHLHELKSVKLAIGVGGAFDFIAGVRKRAPHFLQKLGLEWLWRLFQEPSRIRRIWNATVKFPYVTIFSSSRALLFSPTRPRSSVAHDPRSSKPNSPA